jgi:subtilisin family serine protease
MKRSFRISDLWRSRKQKSSKRQKLRTIVKGMEQLEDRRLLAMLNMPNLEAPHFENQVIVKIDPARAEELRAELNAVAVYQSRSQPGLEVWDISASNQTVEDSIGLYWRDDRFIYIEPNYIRTLAATPNDTRYTSGELWGLHNTGQLDNYGQTGTVDADIDAPEAWEITRGSSSVIVGDIDTGVDYTHPDLANNMWVNPGEVAFDAIDNDGNGYVDDIYGWDFFSNDNDPIDGHSHGTHTSGTIGGQGNNGQGVTGVNWDVSIMALQIFSAGGAYAGDVAVADAIDYSIRNGARMTSNSWGGGGFSVTLFDAITRAEQANQLFIAAAGNGNFDNDVFAFYPANYAINNIISVAASDNQDNRAGFSQWGQTTVDLAAPGVSTLSTTPGNTYAFFDGTSMATPHVTGVAALIEALRPNLPYQVIKDAILNSVDVLPQWNNLTVTEGRLNAQKALQKVVTFEDFSGTVSPNLPVGWASAGSGAGASTWTKQGSGTGSYASLLANNDTGETSLLSPGVFIDADQSNSRLQFGNHIQAGDVPWDGGVLEISLDNGATYQDIIAAGGSFVTGGYNATLNASNNPLSGRDAWSGTSNFITEVDLPTAALGKTVQFRWRFGTDNFIQSTGWSVTDINLIRQVANVQNFDGVAAPNLPAGWTNSMSGPAATPWVTNAGHPDLGPNSAFVANPSDISDQTLTSPPLAINYSNSRLRFQNYFQTEDTYDGGVLEISYDNGASFTDIMTAGGTFVSGGYTDTIDLGFGNPLAGRQAWSGDSGGYIESVVDLPVAALGQTIVLHWRMATDNSVSATGWRVDSIALEKAIIDFEDFDVLTTPSLPAGWTTSGASPFTTKGDTDSSTGSSLFIGTPGHSTDNEATSPIVAITKANTRLRFLNSFNTELNFDGGVLEVSIAGGAFQDILAAGGSFVSGGYNNTLGGTGALSGRQAWAGNSGGDTVSIIDLPNTAIGQNVQLRWRFAADHSVTSNHWRIDNVELMGAEHRPDFTSTPVTSVAEDVLYSYSVTTMDVDGTSPSLSATTLPGWLSFTDNGGGNGTLSGTPTNSEVGDHVVVLQASDGITQPVSQTFTVTVTPVNDAPTINNIGGDLTYLENAAPMKLVPLSATITDVDSPNLNGGHVAAYISGGGTASDILEIRTSANLTKSGADLLYLGNVVGTFVEGDGLNPLIVFANSNMTPVIAGIVLRSLQYRNTSNNPTLTRTLGIQVWDGVDASDYFKTINVTPVNDRPVVNNFGSAITYVENAVNPVAITGGTASVSDPDSADFDGGQLKVLYTAGGSASDRLTIRSVGNLSVVGTQVFFSGNLIGTFVGGVGTAPLIVTLTSNAVAGNVATIIRNVMYSNVSDNPTAARTVSVQLNDGDGAQSIAVTKTINVTPINDAPVLGGIPGSAVAYTMNSATAVALASAATLTDVDSANFDTGKLTVQVTSGNQSSDRLEISGATFTISGGNILRLGVVIGTVNVNGGIGLTKLEFTFNSTATPSYVQALIRTIKFKTVGSVSNADRVVSFTVRDGDGGVSATVARTVDVI